VRHPGTAAYPLQGLVCRLGTLRMACCASAIGACFAHTLGLCESSLRADTPRRAMPQSESRPPEHVGAGRGLYRRFSRKILCILVASICDL
jgi:hypothetical protein